MTFQVRWSEFKNKRYTFNRNYPFKSHNLRINITGKNNSTILNALVLHIEYDYVTFCTKRVLVQHRTRVLKDCVNHVKRY
jgi:hypothetical protein